MAPVKKAIENLVQKALKLYNSGGVTPAETNSLLKSSFNELIDSFTADLVIIGPPQPIALHFSRPSSGSPSSNPSSPLLPTPLSPASSPPAPPRSAASSPAAPRAVLISHAQPAQSNPPAQPLLSSPAQPAQPTHAQNSASPSPAPLSPSPAPHQINTKTPTPPPVPSPEEQNNRISEAFEEFGTIVSSAWDGLCNALQRGVQQILEWGVSLWNSVKSFFGRFGGSGNGGVPYTQL